MFFFTSTTPPLLEFFFTPPLAYSTLHFLRQLPLSPRLDFVNPPPPPPHPSPIDFFATIRPDLLFFTNIRHTLLHFKSTTPPPRWSNPLFWSRIPPPPPLCTYLKNSYASDTPPVYFLPQLPLPSWSVSLPLLWHTPPCIVLRQLPLSPRLDFV